MSVHPRTMEILAVHQDIWDPKTRGYKPSSFPRAHTLGPKRYTLNLFSAALNRLNPVDWFAALQAQQCLLLHQIFQG